MNISLIETSLLLAALVQTTNHYHVEKYKEILVINLLFAFIH